MGWVEWLLAILMVVGFVYLAIIVWVFWPTRDKRGNQ